MGKSRKSVAAELSRPQNEDEKDNPPNGAALAAQEVCSAGEGLVLLNSRRPPRERLAAGSPGPGGPASDDHDPPNEIGGQIGAQLRSLYDDVLNQPVPDRFLELLKRLETDTISPPGEKPGER
jgi:hypothetical protein